MKTLFVALAMIVGFGTSVVFAQETTPVPAEPTEQVPAPQGDFVKIELSELPQAILDALLKKYPVGGAVAEAFVADKESGKVYKINVVLTKEDQTTEEVTVFMNANGEPVTEQGEPVEQNA
ncbi:hypothetical protein [Bacteroides reticulotermitis]|uniref:hypothetical protein n=1 Tax=Bacteroides reticulotermitis TaxID=1133319 RepID=UPI003A8A1BB7